MIRSQLVTRLDWFNTVASLPAVAARCRPQRGDRLVAKEVTRLRRSSSLTLWLQVNPHRMYPSLPPSCLQRALTPSHQAPTVPTRALSILAPMLPPPCLTASLTPLVRSAEPLLAANAFKVRAYVPWALPWRRPEPQPRPSALALPRAHTTCASPLVVTKILCEGVHEVGEHGAGERH